MNHAAPVSLEAARARRLGNYLVCECGSAWYRMVPPTAPLASAPGGGWQGSVECRECGRPAGQP